MRAGFGMVLAGVVDASNIKRSLVPYETVPLWLSRMATMVAIVVLVTVMIAGTRAAALGDAIDDRARFDSYRVYRVIPHNEDQLTVLRHLQKSLDELDFWKGPGRVGVPVDVMVPPHLLPDFQDTLEGNNMASELYIKDVQRLVDQQTNVGRSGYFSWSDYHRLNEIYAWLDALEERYPGNVTVIVGGSTYEGRQIKGVKVSFKQGNPGVFLEGGIHAREWVSPATVTYILNQLLTSDEPRIRDIAQNFDWYIFPVFNPDGYEYTHTTNRLWRKTRSPTSDTCHGVDPNRNWGYHWKTGGASSDPCAPHYAGPEAFSEIETRSMSQYITSIADKIDVYLAFHSYSQLLLIPYGFPGPDNYVSNHQTLMEIGLKAAKSLSKQYGTKYIVGNIVDTIYVASGGSTDWVRGTFDTPITYTYELRDTGRYGFLLPAPKIVPTGQETLDSVVTILREGREHIRKQ